MNVRVDTDLQTPFEREISSLIVEALHLEITPEEIRPSEALFGDGLCLDSIDALEIALAVSSRYGFQLKSDDERNQQIFASLRSLAAFVQQHRTRLRAEPSRADDLPLSDCLARG